MGKLKGGLSLSPEDLWARTEAEEEVKRRSWAKQRGLGLWQAGNRLQWAGWDTSCILPGAGRMGPAASVKARGSA